MVLAVPEGMRSRCHDQVERLGVGQALAVTSHSQGPFFFLVQHVWPCVLQCRRATGDPCVGNRLTLNVEPETQIPVIGQRVLGMSGG